MAGQHGGYRKPSKPAMASGPGAMSRRTDGGPSDPQPQRWVPTDDYGGATEMQDIQRGAPMQGETRPNVVPLHAPTQRPDEPITAGAPFGPGPGPRGPDPQAPPVAPRDDVSLLIRAAYSANPSPQLGALMNYLESQGR